MSVQTVVCKSTAPPKPWWSKSCPPRARPGERVSVKAASVNFPDVLIIQNNYQFKPPLAFSPEQLGGVVKESARA